QRAASQRGEPRRVERCQVPARAARDRPTFRRPSNLSLWRAGGPLLMSSAPYMQLYVADYMADTTHLTTEQHGAYLLLLMAMWRNGAVLPNDPKKLARIAGVSTRRWHMIWPDL